MSKGIRVEIEGMDELIKAAKELGEEMLDELENGAESAAQEIAKEANSRAPIGQNRKLRGSFITKRLPRRQGLPAAVMVGNDYNRAPHAHLVEFGTGPRYHAGTGKYVGQMPANPFFRDSVESKRRDVKRTFQTHARNVIDRRR